MNENNKLIVVGGDDEVDEIPKGKQCGDCFFYARTKEMLKGECTRFPPTLNSLMMPATQTAVGVQINIQNMINYPTVPYDFFACGEFKPAVVEPKPVPKPEMTEQEKSRRTMHDTSMKNQGAHDAKDTNQGSKEVESD